MIGCPESYENDDECQSLTFRCNRKAGGSEEPPVFLPVPVASAADQRKQSAEDGVDCAIGSEPGLR